MICTILVILFLRDVTAMIIVKKDNLTLYLEPTSNGILFRAYDGDIKKLGGTLEKSTNFSNVECIGNPICPIDDFNFSVVPIENGFKFRWKTYNLRKVFEDCFELKEAVQWYGGPTMKSLVWPVQKNIISGGSPYLLLNARSFSYAERYWLNSLGAYIFIDDNIPLYVDQNNKENSTICFIADVSDGTGPYFNRTRNILEYYLVFKDNPKEAHLHAVNNFLGKPTGHPNPKMISEPIWTTWAKYKTHINDSILIEFASEIRKQGYENGQIEVDDNWERCYGAQEFAASTFADVKNTIKKLKDMDFRVTLWIHPFVNSDCQNNADIGKQRDWFVRDKYGNYSGWWWNSNDSYEVDFTNREATKWWVDRVTKIRQDIGIDSFKFDAGETDFSPQPSVYKHVDQELIPNIFSASYLRTCATFGTLIEVRSGWRTQDLPIFTRMLDKDSNWDFQNGLYSLITTLIQMNMVGYTMVLPDMIGGNGYFNVTPDAELFVRWTQANTFMPAMQFSYLPWEYTEAEFDVANITKKFVDLHQKYSDVIINAMEISVKDGSPVNPPIWWIDPTDQKALVCDNEFLVGEEILVAPVLEQGATTREVYLPKGRWKDGNNGTYYQGPISFNYTADITVLPYFIFEKSEIVQNYSEYLAELVV